MLPGPSLILSFFNRFGQVTQKTLGFMGGPKYETLKYFGDEFC